MKTSRIIGIVICILIPLVITGFMANYVYNDTDDIMGNKGKWEEYYKEKQFGTTMLEKFTSNIKLNSAFYNTVPLLNEVDPNNRFKVALFNYVNPGSNTVLYTLYIYAVDFTQLDIESTGNLKVVFAYEAIDLSTEDEEDVNNPIKKAAPTVFFVVPDTEATIKPADLEEDETYKEYAYYYDFSQVTEVGDDATLTFRIDLIDDDNEYVETLFGTEAGYEVTNIEKSAKRFEDMAKNEGSTITSGLSGNKMKFGKGYTAYIFPTVLWICAVTLVISGGLSYLFYLIWTAEGETKPALPKATKTKKGS